MDIYDQSSEGLHQTIAAYIGANATAAIDPAAWTAIIGDALIRRAKDAGQDPGWVIASTLAVVGLSEEEAVERVRGVYARLGKAQARAAKMA